MAERALGAAPAAALLALAACAGAPERPGPRAPPGAPGAPGDAIVIAGERVPIGAPVVLWFEEPRYDAYRTEPRFRAAGPAGLRYRPGRPTGALGAPGPSGAPGAPSPPGAPGAPNPSGAPRARDRDTLERAIDLLVLHYDACGLSRTCFEVLQDVRGLSVHFLLDVDGTLYQTLDLAEEAWHARQANPRSIGVEIANLGAYPPGAPGSPGEPSPLDAWYAADELGPRLTIPPGSAPGASSGVRTPGFVARPARAERVAGVVQGELREQVDFTPEQYRTLARLAAALARRFPRLALEAPRGPDGMVRTDALTAEELASFHGVLGHLHVTSDKLDPGPAFDWEGFLAAARAAGAVP